MELDVPVAIWRLVLLSLKLMLDGHLDASRELFKFCYWICRVYMPCLTKLCMELFIICRVLSFSLPSKYLVHCIDILKFLISGKSKTT
jgi:hypothetical protein